MDKKVKELVVLEGFSVLKCYVKDSNGNSCPSPPEVWATVDGRRMKLCRICYGNIVKGSYGPKKVSNVILVKLYE